MSLPELLAGRSRSDIARAIGVSRMTVYRLASGRRKLCDRRLVTPLAIALGVDSTVIASQLVRDRRCAL